MGVHTDSEEMSSTGEEVEADTDSTEMSSMSGKGDTSEKDAFFLKTGSPTFGRLPHLEHPQQFNPRDENNEEIESANMMCTPKSSTASTTNESGQPTGSPTAWTWSSAQMQVYCYMVCFLGTQSQEESV